MLAVVPTDRRVVSAVRRFPPDCGRPRNAAAQKPQRPLPSSTTKPQLPNPSARATTTSAAPPPRGTVCAAASTGAMGTDRGAGNGRETAEEVTVRRASAVRRYPPGCGRGIAAAVPKPPVLVVEGEGEAGASKPPGESCVDAKAKGCDREVVLCERATDDGCEFSSDGGMENGGGGDHTGVLEESYGKPWVVTGLMALPFVPWAQHGHGRRSQRVRA